MMHADVRTAIVPLMRIPAAIALRGPGRLGEDGPQSVMLFDAGESCRSRDMVIRFFAEEIDQLLWLEDYMMDPTLLAVGAAEVDAPPGIEEEDESLYMKDVLTTTDTDPGNYGDAQ